MVRGRGANRTTEAESQRRDSMLDVNAIVSYNLKWIRERKGWTQQDVADRLALMTKHQLPQASISAMERGFDGERRRRFDAHELYLFSVVFGVPIMFFFLRPPNVRGQLLADSERPVGELYASVLGFERGLDLVDERLAELGIMPPDEDDVLTELLFGRDGRSQKWFRHFRLWRKERIDKVAKEHEDRLEELADFLLMFAQGIKTFGPRTYLQTVVHREGEASFLPGNPSRTIDMSADDPDEAPSEEDG